MDSGIHIPGKLFMAGEYAVLEPGHSSAVLAVNRTLQVAVERTPDSPLIAIPQWGLRIADLAEPAQTSSDPRDQFVRRLVAAAASLARRDWTVSLSAEPHDNDLLGRDLGLGTSAALAVAVARALLADEAPDSRAVLDLALRAHGAVQGTRSSGADVAAAWAGCSIRYEQRDNDLPLVEPLKPPEPWPFVALFSGHSQRTGEAVRSYDSAKAADGAGWQTCMDAIRVASEDVLAAVPQGVSALVPALDRAADASQQLADWLGAPPPVPNQLRENMRAAGAAVKSSGAIGGDCAIVIARDGASLEAATRLAQEAGYEPLPDIQPVFA